MAQYGGFWRRVVAYIIDSVIMGVVTVALVFAFGMGAGLGLSGATPEEISAASLGINLISLLLTWLYSAGFESSARQATPGKMALGMVVTDLHGNRISFLRATGRFFGKIVSSVILLIGFIMVAFTQRKQGLHDIMAGTLVPLGKPGTVASAAVFE